MVLRTAINLPLVQELDAAEVLQLMQTDVTAYTPHVYATISCARDHVESSMRWLVQLPAAKQLDSSIIKVLIDTALARSCHAEQQITALCTLRAAEQMQLEDCVTLLKKSARRSLGTAVAALCRLPAVNKMDRVDVWHDIISATVTDLPDSFNQLQAGVRGLCRLPVARSANHDIIAELLTLALKYDQYPAVLALCGLPAAQQIPKDHLIALTFRIVIRVTWPADPMLPFSHMSWTVSRSAVNALTAITKLKSVRDVSTAELLDFFHILVWDGNLQQVIQWLCSLPAAWDIPVNWLKQQMQEAVQESNLVRLQALCSLPAASHIDLDTLDLLFAAACQSRSNISRGIQQELRKLAKARLAL